MFIYYVFTNYILSYVHYNVVFAPDFDYLKVICFLLRYQTHRNFLLNEGVLCFTLGYC